MLAESGLDCELRLAGDGSMRVQLEALAKALHLSDKITFLGFINEKQIAEELQQADIFVLTSYVEGVPVSAMEAMAVGVPVVATNVGGTSELIQEGISGLLVRPSDVDTVYAALRKLITNFDLRMSIAKNGRAVVEREFNSELEFAKLNQHFLSYGHRSGKIPVTNMVS
jgi:glycosyltransferase involved in cell wall biosynthesis